MIEETLEECPEFENLLAFGETHEEAVDQAKIAAEGYIEVMKEDNESVPEPNQLSNYSGQTRIRMPKTLHHNLAVKAQQENVSLNSYMVHLLSMNYVYSLTNITIPDGSRAFIFSKSDKDDTIPLFKDKISLTSGSQIDSINVGSLEKKEKMR